MKITMQRSLLAAALVSACAAAFAQQPTGGGAASTTVSSPGKRTDTSIVSIVASVEAVDQAKRTVTLKGPDGKSTTIAVGPEAKNFGQVKVGDQVNVKYIEALTLELKKGGTAPVAMTQSVGGGTAKAGAKPGGAIGREVKVTANVVAVDAATQSVTLKGPERTVSMKVQNPDQFKLIKVGDQVEATYTEALAISVEPVAKKEPAKKK
jgi:hypothetical protein